MISPRWVGACTSDTLFIKNLIETKRSQNDRAIGFLQKAHNDAEESILVSDDLLLLNELLITNPNVPQIYVCTTPQFLTSFQAGLRPPLRYFFLMDVQKTEDLQILLQCKPIVLGSKKKRTKSQGPLLAMQNSLEVLRQLTEERLIKLRAFAHEEESRKKKFRTLLQLARNLSMSQDIEDVAKALWTDLKLLKGLTSLAIFFYDKSGKINTLCFRSGHFRFEEFPGIQFQHLRLFESLQAHHSIQELRPLPSSECELFQIIFNRPLKLPLCLRMESNTPGRTFYLILETEENRESLDEIRAHLAERQTFIQLTLEKHLLQEEIKTKSNLWERTFDDLNDPLAILTQRRQVIRANRQFQNLRGEYCFQVFPHRNAPCVHCPQLVHQISTLEISVQQDIFLAWLFPIPGSPDRSPRAFIAHYVNVTTERTLYSQLVQAEKMIVLGQLAENLSQALSFPLKKISQLVEKVLSDHSITETTFNDLSEIRKASFRSLRLIEDFSHFSSGKLDKELTLAETIVQKTIPLVKALIHGLRFQLQLSEATHPVSVSLSLIQQVLYNLMRNAHQAMKGQGELFIRTESALVNGKKGVKISVLDSGPGVPLHLQGKLFQPFVTTKNSTEGTGLGLNIVKQIVENHGGCVGFEIRPKGGSTFWFWLPLVDEILC